MVLPPTALYLCSARTQNVVQTRVLQVLLHRISKAKVMRGTSADLELGRLFHDVRQHAKYFLVTFDVASSLQSLETTSGIVYKEASTRSRPKLFVKIANKFPRVVSLCTTDGDKPSVSEYFKLC